MKEKLTVARLNGGLGKFHNATAILTRKAPSIQGLLIGKVEIKAERHSRI